MLTDMWEGSLAYPTRLPRLSIDMVLAPDEQEEGTNALLVAPSDRMRTCFGRRGSFHAHSERAAAMSLEVAAFRAASLIVTGGLQSDGPFLVTVRSRNE